MISPCKILLKKWKICNISNCHYCNTTEDYHHMFLSFVNHQYDQDVGGILDFYEMIGKCIFKSRNKTRRSNISDRRPHGIGEILKRFMTEVHIVNPADKSSSSRIMTFKLFQMFNSCIKMFLQQESNIWTL